MKLITTFSVLLVIIKLVKSAPDPCLLRSEESACDQTDYEAYKDCVHNEAKNEVRKKRQAPCPTQNNLESFVSIKENCQRANFDCRIECGDDENCQSQCPVCPINVDELIASSNTTEVSHRTIIVDSDQNVEKFETIAAPGNITTVIRLTNVINTTSSFSDVPPVESGDLSSETGGEFGLGFNANGSCCHVVHPKQCTSTSNGRRCHHRREKVCGKICTAKVVHVQARKRCNGNGCHKKVSYIPQPKPICVHTQQWPFVACGQPFSSNCDGCYDHYDDVDDDDDDETNTKERNDGCGGCYDDGFEYGPLYRQGPVFRPHYYHVPPCYIVGSCIPYPLSDGYGNHGGYNHKRRRPQGGNDDEATDVEDVDYTDGGEVVKTSVPANGTEDAADGWAIELHKCKVVSDNGTIEIRNCTSEDIEQNPYAGAPPDVPFDEDEDYDGLSEGIRIQRHANHHRQFRHPQVVYVPVVDEFNYDEVTSGEYDDFDEAPRHRRRVKQSKSSSKRHNRKTSKSFVYDDDEE